MTGPQLKEYRSQAGLSVADFAKAAGITNRAMQRIETREDLPGQLGDKYANLLASYIKSRILAMSAVAQALETAQLG